MTCIERTQKFRNISIMAATSENEVFSSLIIYHWLILPFFCLITNWRARMPQNTNWVAVITNWGLLHPPPHLAIPCFNSCHLIHKLTGDVTSDLLQHRTYNSCTFYFVYRDQSTELQSLTVCIVDCSATIRFFILPLQL